LAAATPLQQELANFVWQRTKQHGFVVRWRPTAYTVRARHPVTKQEMTFLYGYRIRVDFYLAFLALPEDEAADLRSALLATGLYSPSGQQTLIGENVDMGNRQRVFDSLDFIFQRVADFLAGLKHTGA
jgi:hypothetical protein